MSDDKDNDNNSDDPEKKSDDSGEVEQSVSSADIPRYERRLGLKKDEKDGDPEIWLISFTDVMALMLTFFVMLFSMSNPQQDDWEEMSSALHFELNKYYGMVSDRGPIDAINLEHMDFNQALNLSYLKGVLQGIVDDNEYLSAAQLIEQPTQLIISLPQDLLFSAGEASVQDNGARALYALGGSLSRIKNKVEIIGHADPRPIEKSENRFSSNWELSLARAISVASILNSVGYERDIDVRGLSSGRYDDLASTVADSEARLDLSRRVDIIVKNHDGRKREVLFDIFGD